MPKVGSIIDSLRAELELVESEVPPEIVDLAMAPLLTAEYSQPCQVRI